MEGLIILSAILFIMAIIFLGLLISFKSENNTMLEKISTLKKENRQLKNTVSEQAARIAISDGQIETLKEENNKLKYTKSEYYKMINATNQQVKSLQEWEWRLNKASQEINLQYANFSVIKKDISSKLDEEISKIIWQNSVEIKKRCELLQEQYLKKTQALDSKEEELKVQEKHLGELSEEVSRKYANLPIVKKDIMSKLDEEISKIIWQNSIELNRRCSNVEIEYLQKLKALDRHSEELETRKKAFLEDKAALEKEKESYKESVLLALSKTDDRLKWYKDILDSLDFSKDVSYRIYNNYFISLDMYPKFIESLKTERAASARKGDFDIDVCELVAIRAKIHSKESGKTYETSLETCTCEDFQVRKLPCKHMLALAFSINAFVRQQPSKTIILQEISEAIKEQREIKCSNFQLKQKLKAYAESLKDEKQKALRSIQVKEERLEKEKRDFAESYKKKKEYLELLEKASKEKLQTFPYLADIMAKYKVEMCEIKVRDPVTKKELTSKLKSLEKQVAMLENQLAIYEYTFPILEELKTLDVHELEQAVRNADDTGFNYQWLSEEEYATLTSVEKQEKWLDRYFHARSRTAWEAGIKYERYIGYLCEKEGYSVKYTGALLKLEDMGRDLIVTKKNKVYIIQCKRFSENKEIHENHVFQLYGSIYHYKAENPNKNVCGVFVTSAKLSEVARACANDLSLLVFENIAFQDYPCIKCNVSSNGEKIYHLPFDQQYDYTHIGKHAGECYVSTVREAQELGFRHAMKHTYIS